MAKRRYCCGEFLGHSVEDRVELEEVLVGGGRWCGDLVEVNPAPPRPASAAIPGVVNQHPPHRLGRGGEEVRFGVEVLVPDQP